MKYIINFLLLINCMRIPSTHLYYYYNIDYSMSCFKTGIFYIGNHNIFITGKCHQNYNQKIKLNIEIINVACYNHCASYNAISSNSYQEVDTLYFDSIEDAINIQQMLKYWHSYHDFKCTKLFIQYTTFRIDKLCDIIQYKSNSLVDYIIYNKKLAMEDMKSIPFSYELREKINTAYNKQIFNLAELE